MTFAEEGRGEGLVHGLIVAAFMVVYIAGAACGASGYDSARDVAEAWAIAQGHALPLHGPALGGVQQLGHLGPLWFYLLALPLALHPSWLAVALFVAAVGSLQFPLAYATGRRLLDRRLGLLWCAMLALPGWGTLELVGFAHTNAVGVTTMLTLYALTRLAMERQPRWLVLAAFALTLALHAHPTTLPLAAAVVAVAVLALRERGVLLRWGALALMVAVLPLLPLAAERFLMPAQLAQRGGADVGSMASFANLANLANLPALAFAVLVRGPRVVADAFFAWAPWVPSTLWGIVLGIEALAVAGLAMAWRSSRALVLAALALVAVSAIAIAMARPVTPFYMTYALLPLLAGAGALGLRALCETARSTRTHLCAAMVALLLALHVGKVTGIAAAVGSGSVALSVAPLLDVKRDEATPSQPSLWLPAYAVDRSGAILCAHPGPVVLHGAYASLEDSYFGLDHRLACGAHDVRLLGAEPAGATHLVGLALPLWHALGWQPATTLGGMGVAPASRVIAPHAGQPVPDGLTYPPYAIPAGPARAVRIDAVLRGDEALVVSFPFTTWLPEPALRVSVNGAPAIPLARDGKSVVFACRPCASEAAVDWRVELESAKPEWIDVVALTPPA